MLRGHTLNWVNNSRGQKFLSFPSLLPIKFTEILCVRRMNQKNINVVSRPLGWYIKKNKKKLPVQCSFPHFYWIVLLYISQAMVNDIYMNIIFFLVHWMDKIYFCWMKEFLFNWKNRALNCCYWYAGRYGVHVYALKKFYFFFVFDGRTKCKV